VREYPNLAIQKLGGTKPQNISQLNSERRGDNCLLASLPPVWQSLTVKPLFGVDSMFKVFGWRRQVRTLAADLRHFLEADPDPNLETRTRRDEVVANLLDELMQFSAEVHTLDPGWSADVQCDLSPAHIAWLDPQGTDVAIADVIDRIAGDFANWLNAQLRDPLPTGDAEYLHWRKQARELFKHEERKGPNEPL
jgi:CRISPR-associated protein Csy1